MYAIDETDFLSHHGILGMHWGKRHGPPYPLDQQESREIRKKGREELSKKKEAVKELKKRASETGKASDKYKARWAEEDLKNWITENKMANRAKASKWEEKYKQEYLSKGYSEKDAAIAAYRKAQTQKALLIIGGVALTAAIGYGLYKSGQFNTDSIIKAGTNFQRIARDSGKEAFDSFYATPSAKDFTKYKGFFGNQLRSEGAKNLFAKTIGTSSNLKIAGGDSGTKIVSKALENNQGLRDLYYRLGLQSGMANVATARNIKAGKIGKAEYEAINRMFTLHDGQAIDSAHKALYEKFKEAGYHGIKDINDMKYSGYMAKAPTILFNGEHLTTTSVKQLSNDEITSAFVSATAKNGAIYTAATLGSIGGISVAGFGMNKAQSAINRNQVVSQYRKEHPNTKLSYNQIWRMQAEQLGL